MEGRTLTASDPPFIFGCRSTPPSCPCRRRPVTTRRAEIPKIGKYKSCFRSCRSYVGSTQTVIGHHRLGRPGTATPTRGPRTLVGCRAGDTVIVDGIDLDERHRFRLMELGLRAGVVIRVVQRSGFGGRVVARGPERIALDGGTARAIRVRISDDTEETTR
ncbi:MAG: FeoA family protein [Bifidobacterium pullorum]